MKTFCRSRALLIKVIKVIRPFASGERFCTALNRIYESRMYKFRKNSSHLGLMKARPYLRLNH